MPYVCFPWSLPWLCSVMNMFLFFCYSLMHSGFWVLPFYMFAFLRLKRSLVYASVIFTSIELILSFSSPWDVTTALGCCSPEGGHSFIFSTIYQTSENFKRLLANSPLFLFSCSNKKSNVLMKWICRKWTIWSSVRVYH